MTNGGWPPKFTISAAPVLELFTGESFYSSVDASIREAVLNAIDAIGRRRDEEPDLAPHIEVVFDVSALTVTVSDNGDGMGQGQLNALFTKIGASAAAIAQQSTEAQYRAVGEFGIGILSYFLVSDHFEIHTVRANSEPIGLAFSRAMLDAETHATALEPKRTDIGTALILSIQEEEHFTRLIEQFDHWFRDVEGLRARKEPGAEEITQGGLSREVRPVEIDLPQWIHKAHIGPPELFSSWDTFDGAAHVDILYHGVFVDRIIIDHLWAIEGAIHVDPKHFRPKLNREGFVGQDLQAQLEPFLRSAHPRVLEKALECVREVLQEDQTREWSHYKWVTLWLAVPRTGPYAKAAQLWDEDFRSRKAFKLLLPGGRDKDVSVADLNDLGAEHLYVAPVRLDRASEIVRHAVRVLRERDLPVVQGIHREEGFLARASLVGPSTGELLWNHFREELPALVQVETVSAEVVGQEAVIDIFDEQPFARLMRLGPDAAPVIPVSDDLWINIDVEAGKRIVGEVCNRNEGHIGLWVACLIHAPAHVQQVVNVLAKRPSTPNKLGPVRRQYLRGLVA